jgi:hypothetical protein
MDSGLRHGRWAGPDAHSAGMIFEFGGRRRNMLPAGGSEQDIGNALILQQIRRGVNTFFASLRYSLEPPRWASLDIVAGSLGWTGGADIAGSLG